MRVRSWRRANAALIGFAVLISSSAGAATITWSKHGAFEACLETAFEKWVRGQAELMVNEDPAAARLDDAAVAIWTVETAEGCGKQTGGDAASEDRFKKHMAHWRQHIYDLATSIREKGRSD